MKWGKKESRQTLVELVKQAASEAATVPTLKVQNAFFIHGGRQVFVQATSKRTSPKAKPPAKGRS